MPVDYVAAAIDHIAHQDGLDGQAFHLVDPKAQQRRRRAQHVRRAPAHAPQTVMRIDKQHDATCCPKGVLVLRDEAAGAQGHPARSCLADLGIPDEVARLHRADAARFDARDTKRALEGSGIELPPLETYADKLWDYWERNLDPDLFKDRSFEGAVNGKTVVITGASSGIGRAAALQDRRRRRDPDPRRAHAGEARRGQGGDRGDGRHRLRLLRRPVRLRRRSTRWSRRSSSDHAAIDMLVNNAGRSIRRSVALSYDRFHDYERTIQLNYLGAVKLILGAAAAHDASARRRPHRQRLLDRRADQPAALLAPTSASKAALDAFTRVVLARRSATTSRSRRSTCRSCARR